MAKSTDRWRERREFSNRPLKEQLKDLLSLHTGERRGTAAMIIILTALMLVYVYVQWFRQPTAKDLEPLRAEMEAWIASRDSAESKAEVAVELFAFDPNEIERADWRRLGLNDRQVDGIERYREKGGRFRKKADLGRMYSIRPEQFEALKPYILLPDSLPQRRDGRKEETRRTESWKAREERKEPPSPRQERHAFAKIEVNTADTNALIALPGIGPSFARGIVKYRESLGGYHSLDQLAEVYVLKDKPDAVARLRELLVVDTLMIRRIPINTCTAEELAAHPYVRWKLAKPIIAYRQQHGPFKELAGLKGIHLIDEGLFRKLAPYLTLE